MGGMKHIEVLLVEDNKADALLVSELLDGLGVGVRSNVVRNGKEALGVLQSRVDLRKTLPDLVVLDLNLPLIGGFEVLARMKADPLLERVPVLVMTGSVRKEDEMRARSMGVIAYCIKPATEDEFEAVIRCLKSCLNSIDHNPTSQRARKSTRLRGPEMSLQAGWLLGNGTLGSSEQDWYLPRLGR